MATPSGSTALQTRHPATDERRSTTRNWVPQCRTRPAIVRGVARSEDSLAGEPFSNVERADGSIVVRYHEAPVTILRGRTAERFAARIASADAAKAQHLMARVTGNFKRSSERR